MNVSILHVEDPTTERTCLCNDHTICICVLQFYWRGDGIGTVLYVYERVLRHTSHAGINRQRSAITHQIRSARDRRIKTFRSAVVDRKNMIFDSFLREEVLKLF